MYTIFTSSGEIAQIESSTIDFIMPSS